MREQEDGPAATGSSAGGLDRRAALDVLTWAAERFAPRIAFATGFGVEGCVVIDLIARHRLPIDVFTLDTGLLFPETYTLWRRLEQRYGMTIRAVRPHLTVEQQAGVHGDKLWERDADACCGVRKEAPLRAVLAGLDAWVTAIRRDQSVARGQAKAIEPDRKFGLVKVNPLVTWSAEDVRAYLSRHDVPYNALHDRGYPSIGCVPCTTPVGAGEDARAGRWRGRGKTECGLHTSHPARLASLRTEGHDDVHAR